MRFACGWLTCSVVALLLIILHENGVQISDDTMTLSMVIAICAGVISGK